MSDERDVNVVRSDLIIGAVRTFPLRGLLSVIVAVDGVLEMRRRSEDSEVVDGVVIVVSVCVAGVRLT